MSGNFKSEISICNRRFAILGPLPVYNYGASKRIFVPQKAGTTKYKETLCLVWSGNLEPPDAGGRVPV